MNHAHTRRVSLNIPKLSWALLASLFLLPAGSCQNPAPTTPFVLPGTETTPGFTLDFGGYPLVGPGPVRDTRLPGDLSTYRSEQLRGSAWPAIERKANDLCFLSQNRIYFDLEAGLRLRICLPVAPDQDREIARVLATLREKDANPPATARPAYHGQTVSIELRRLASLSGRIGHIRISVDGNPEKQVLSPAKLAGDLAFVSVTPAAKEDDSIYLPRRFSESFAHWLVTEESLALLYPLPESTDHYLVLTFARPLLATLVDRGLRRIPAILRKLEAAATGEPARTTEVYFAAQGNAGDEYLELSSFERDAKLAYVVQSDGGHRLEDERFAFAHSSRVLRRADGLRLDREVEVGPSSDEFQERLSHADLAPRGAGRHRSLTRGDRSAPDTEIRTLPFQPATSCVAGQVCGSPGIHPEIVRRLGSVNENACRPGDFRLSEWNPFGIVTEHRGDPAGKFIEFEVRRSCRAGRVLFRVGTDADATGLLLDPGFVDFAAGEVLLFAAGSSVFAARERPGRLRFVVDTRLRSLQPEHALAGLEIAETTRTDNLLPEATPYYEPPPGPVDFLPGERVRPGGGTDEREANAILKRVHSLLPPAGGVYPRFHRDGTPGLRPDLALHHAMSPGRLSPPAPPLATGETTPSFQEVSPAGAYASDGTSLPGEEFLELAYPPTSIPRDETLVLEIRDGSNGRERIYLLPGPGTRPRNEQRLFVWSRDEPVCHERSAGWVRDAALLLPNGEGVYSLRYHDGRLFDRLELQDYEYDGLDRNGVRRSLAYVPAAETYRPSGGPASFAHACGANTAATPGAPNATAAFLKFHEEQADFHALRLFTDRGGETVAWSTGYDFNAPFQSGSETLFAGDVLSIPLPASAQGRLLIEAHPKSAPEEGSYLAEVFPGGQALFFADIAPTPPPGGHEWIRICSRDGFDPEHAAELVLRDSRSDDRIVPFRSRFPLPVPLPLALNGDSLGLAPGRCAILIDPDLNSATDTGLPDLRPEDAALWTVASSATLGNGLASGEGLLLLQRDAEATRPLASYGLPDTNRPFAIATTSGERVQRKAGNGAFAYDRIEAYEVVR